MAFTLDQYTALVAAIAQGALKVEYGDKKVEYRSLADMLLLKGKMEEELSLVTVRSRKVYPEFSKGLFPTTDNTNFNGRY